MSAVTKNDCVGFSPIRKKNFWADVSLVLKYMVSSKCYEKNIFIFIHTTKFFKEKINHIIFLYNNNSKICISMHFGFNNQFIKVTRMRSIFQKFKKNYFVFF
jgi:hypothetical protein